MTAVIEVIHRLRPSQQDMICCSVRDHLRKDCHRGTLPFLSIEDALQVMKKRLERCKANVTGDDPRVVGEAFCRQIISILESAVPYAIAYNEVSEWFNIDERKLQNHLQKRYGKKCCLVFGSSWQGTGSRVAQLTWVSTNTWKVTTKPEWMEQAIEVLKAIRVGEAISSI